MSFEPLYAEPQQAVKKPMGFPAGMSAPPLTHPPVTNTPGSSPSPGAAPRVNPYEYGPSAPPEYRAPLRQKRGLGGGYTGWDPATEMPRDRTIPRSRHQQPEQYRPPGSRPKTNSRLNGRRYGPENIRIPTTNPGGIPRSGGIPKGSVLGTAASFIIEPYLNPLPTTEPTFPDWFNPPPDPGFSPEPGDQTSVCGQPCVSGSDYGNYSNSPGRVYQYQVTEFTDVGDTSTGYVQVKEEPWSRSLGIAKIYSSDGFPDGFVIGGLNVELGVAGKITYTDADGRDYSQWIYSHQFKGKIPFTGRKWSGAVGLRRGFPWLATEYKTPDPENDYFPRLIWEKIPSRISIRYMCTTFVCDKEYDISPRRYDNNPDDEDDEDMPCKWKEENDEDVNQLEMTEVLYKIFTSCSEVDGDGRPRRFDERRMYVPAGMAEALRTMLDCHAETLAAQCDIDAVAAVPDWWQVRIGANRPQLVVLYARKFDDGSWDKPKYSISIPHWTKTEEDTTLSNLPEYDKGQKQGMVVFSDNSKLIINAKTEGECNRVIDALLDGIDSSKKEGMVTTITDRKGKELRQIKVYPRVAKYFATGQMNMSPTWRKKLQ